MEMADRQVIYIGMGSNVGDSNQIFDKAINVLAQHIEIQQQSHRFVTKAMYNTQQDDFLNMVIRAATFASARQLLTLFKNIEQNFGRDLQAARYAPRPLDMDLLFYGNHIIDEDDLKVPHPLLYERKFVLEPLVQVTSNDFYDPHSGKRVTQLLADLFRKQGKTIPLNAKPVHQSRAIKPLYEKAPPNVPTKIIPLVRRPNP
ncbi:MAG: 2-amino-4-hydroxy-6-hydroxymethyldihydropteridine diphosphokinase [Alphaproteobacteria bacterium]|nr:2-amino-4-hydroxy-6-hydroxymethyldihydropteridine diphosphokinase [Alphaproteobacteria bacterium]